MNTNIVVFLVALALNGGAWLRQRAVDHAAQAAGLTYTGQVLTCQNLYGHAFPADSVRERDLMIAIGCANGRDTMALARIERPGATQLLDSLSVRMAGEPRADSVLKKAPER